LSRNILPPTTAGIDPEKFPAQFVFTRSRRAVILILCSLLVVGFFLRVNDIGVESLGEDELNKLQTAEEYRANGLSGRNGEHPFLMKGMQTVSISISESIGAALSTPISAEAALRFPVALFGTFTVLLLYLLLNGLFGRDIAIVAAALWAVEPMAVGFDRIAKEDSLVLFFFLLTNLFWINGQAAAETGNPRWSRNAWAAAVGFAGLMASKYYPHLLAVTAGYYNIFRDVPGKRWNMEKRRWLGFFIIMGGAFILLNPTVLFPETWRAMLEFSTEQRIGHDAYEFMGHLYRNQMTAWLNGVPWTFYYVFIAVKTSLSTLVLFLVGLPLMFRRQLGDGRFFLFFWAFFWFLPFTVLGGKFTRYFTIVEPLILTSAAVAFCFSVAWISRRTRGTVASALQITAFAGILLLPLINSILSSPHYRMFTNVLGGGDAAAGSYFPHDEFYDAATREVVNEISTRAQNGATVACETPELYRYYAGLAGRGDLRFVSLSAKSEVGRLEAGDLIVLARGRRYFSNTQYQEYLEGAASPVARISLAGVPAVRVYQLNASNISAIRAIAASGQS
jgi:hypothetical protein